MNIQLIRGAQNDDGTFGMLVANNVALCVTLEEEWRNNSRNISCIPAGTYKCVPHNGTKYKGVWRLLDVPGRSAILIHSGNTEEHTEGCILVGSRFDKLGNKQGILRSMVALRKIQKILPDYFTLTIKEAFND